MSTATAATTNHKVGPLVIVKSDEPPAKDDVDKGWGWGTWRHSPYQKAADYIREHKPGVWMELGPFTRGVAAQVGHRFHRGDFGPGFQRRQRSRPDGTHWLYLRYVGRSKGTPLEPEFSIVITKKGPPAEEWTRPSGRSILADTARASKQWEPYGPLSHSGACSEASRWNAGIRGEGFVATVVRIDDDGSMLFVKHVGERAKARADRGQRGWVVNTWPLGDIPGQYS